VMRDQRALYSLQRVSDQASKVRSRPRLPSHEVIPSYKVLSKITVTAYWLTVPSTSLAQWPDPEVFP
jgi:hypothetical protein